jgi:hypothetical protein
MGILVLLLIVAATQYKRIKAVVVDLMGQPAAVEVTLPQPIQHKHFDPAKSTVPPDQAQYVTVAAEYNFATALNSGTVPADDPDARYVSDNDAVIGVAVGTEACAFPLSVMRHHLLANHKLGDQSVVVTYSPFTDSSAVYVNESGAPFMPTNQVYNCAAVIHDTAGGDPTFYSHFTGQGLAGPKASQPLAPVRHTLTSWGRWKAEHPQTQVARRDPGSSSQYAFNQYSAYLIDVDKPYYPYANQDESFPWRQRVLGVRGADLAKAFPLDALKAAGQPVTDTLGNKAVTIEFQESDSERPLALVRMADDSLVSQPSLWFAWHAFYPDTTVHR